MTLNTEDLINSIMESLDRIKLVDSKDIPNIDLYMDQVTTFMDAHLRDSSRYKGEDKILTKTMINNYAKNNLLPPPDKKKYSKEHILILVLIYYFKNILSISDIQMMLNPLTEKYFGKDESFSIEEIYDEVTRLGMVQIDELKEDVLNKYKEAGQAFTEASSEEQEFLQIFSFICMLSFDVYVKKLLIEKLLDEYSGKAQEKLNEKKEKNEKKAKK